MKLDEYSRKKAKNFLITWTAIYCFLFALVVWTIFTSLQIERQIIHFLPFTLLMSIVLISIIIAIFSMWKHYLNEQFDKLRDARNISFFVILFLYPLAIIINMLFDSIFYH